MLRKIFKITLIAFASLGLLVLIVMWALDKPIPPATPGPPAEALAQKMAASIHLKAWDSLHYLTWESGFDGSQIVWDKQLDWVYMAKGDSRYWFDCRSGRGLANEPHEAAMDSSELNSRLAERRNYFWNDAFWMAAFTKIFDPGVIRQKAENHQNALLVTYQSGGSTPGDSYLWELDSNGRPEAWRVWAKVLPIGGLRFTWEDWTELPGGALYAKTHKVAGITFRTDSVNAGPSLASIQQDSLLFEPLEKIITLP